LQHLREPQWAQCGVANYLPEERIKGTQVKERFVDVEGNYSKVGQAALAEDLTSEVFLKAVRAALNAWEPHAPDRGDPRSSRRSTRTVKPVAASCPAKTVAMS
jgi:hypothetical protein